MPFINTKLSVALNRENEAALKERLGKAAAALGKSEDWLMLNFEDNCRLWFKGDNTLPSAFADISLYGRAARSQYDEMTAEVTKAISDVTGISPDRIYVKYSEIETWGFCGSNF